MGEETRLAVLFADISGSTRLYEQLGNDRARQVTSRCLERLMGVTRQFGGRVVKTIGDEVMTVFDNAVMASGAATCMQEEVQDLDAEMGAHLKIRVGFSYGPVLLEGHEIFGETVILASEVCARAKPDQILLTEAARAGLDPILRANARPVPNERLRSGRGGVAVFELTWGDKAEITLSSEEDEVVQTREPAGLRLELSFQGESWTLDGNSPGFTMGRGRENDLAVVGSAISRAHAWIEFRRDRFVLIDRSSNGTWIHWPGEPACFLHRDQHDLTGAGHLSLGESLAPEAPLAVTFAVRE
ncbi:MAG: adenylate/guanylate cyclase domain-containing protein [Magnetococcales bacterium]|nr:adenylate/guanylate cyclase domain-containing protein [Magnetococcales bacterium]